MQALHKLMEEPRPTSFNFWVDGPRGEVSRRVMYTGSELDRLRRMALSLGGRDLRRAPHQTTIGGSLPRAIGF